MINLDHLIRLADAYRAAEALPEKTVSGRVFGDQKKLTALKGGSDITVSRFNSAVEWFATNWPDGADWPEGIERPTPSADGASA